MGRDPSGVATYRENIYTTDALLDPYPHYQRLRRLNSVVWLAKHKVYALPRYAECKAALRNDGLFLSGNGVALNPLSNRLSRGTTLNSDGAEHDRRRKLLAHRLLPKALRSVGEDIDKQADAVVDAAMQRGTVDAVADLATALPLAIVPDLVGWPRDERDHLIAWGGATFDVLGPVNWQAVRAIPRTLQMLRFARRVVRERSVLDGSMAHELLCAADDGKLARAECSALMIDYIAPSLDTTISAISNAVYLLAAHPDQWRLLKKDTGLIPNTINEVLRFESPLRAFARKVRDDTEVGGTPIPAGSRILIMYASANRDEEEWDDPDTFDIRRDARRHVAFGNGTHACAGQGLARLETEAMLRALLERVDRIEMAEQPSWAENNIIRRHHHLPVKLIAA
jgi:cytochrome P450